MSEKELTAKEEKHAKEIYAKYGDDTQALSRAVWKELGNLGHNDELVYKPQTRHDVEQKFLEQLSKESHDHHKKTFVEFTDPYGNHDKQHVEIGTSRGWIKDHDSSDMKNLKDLKPMTFSKDEQNRADGLYWQLGDKHNNLNHLQNHFQDSTLWTCQDESSKTSRDHILNAFSEKANQDRNCPYHFDVVSNDKHVVGFTAKDKHSGKTVQEITLHDDRY